MKSSCRKIGAGCRVLRSRRTCRILSLVVALVLLQAGLSAAPASAQNVQVSPSSLSATLVKGQSTTLTLNLKKSGSDQHVWEPKTSVNWVTLSPNYGSINTITTETDTVRVTVNTTHMPVGVNSGLVYVWNTAPGVSRLLTVPITVSVTQGTIPPSLPPAPSQPVTSPPLPAALPPVVPPASPPTPPSATPQPVASLNSNITAFPAALSATLVKGQSTTLNLNLKKSGSDQHVWEPKTSVNWVTLSPNYGSINTITNELDTVKVTVNTAGMKVGANSGLVYIWDSGSGSQRLITVPLIVNVTQSAATQPPPASPPPASPPPSPVTSPSASVTPPPPVSPPSPSPASPPPASPPPSSMNSTITALPAALSTTVVKGQSRMLTVNLQKTGPNQHFWEPKTSVNWISLSPPYGSNNTITTELDQVGVTINTASLVVGTNSALVYILESGPGVSRLITVPVTVIVTQSGATASSPPPASPPPPTAPSPIGSVTPPPPPSPIGSVTPPPPSPPAPTTGVANVTWAANSEADLAGYKLYVGTASGVYNQVLDAGMVTSYKMTLPKGVTYFFSITAYDRSGNESSRSTEVSRSIF